MGNPDSNNNNEEEDSYWDGFRPEEPKNEEEDEDDQDESEFGLDFPDVTESSGLKDFYLSELDKKIAVYVDQQTNALKRKIAIIFTSKDGIGSEVFDLYKGDTVEIIQQRLQQFIESLCSEEIDWSDLKIILKKTGPRNRPQEKKGPALEENQRIAEWMETILSEINEILYEKNGTDWKSSTLDSLLATINSSINEYIEDFELQNAGVYMSLILYFDAMNIEDKALLNKYIVPLFKRDLTEDDAKAVLQFLEKKSMGKEAISTLIFEGHLYTQLRCQERIQKTAPFGRSVIDNRDAMKKKIEEIAKINPFHFLPELKNN